MNAFAFFRGVFGERQTATPVARPPAQVTKARKWVSYFDTLTPEQQKAVLAYDGDETVGDPEMLRVKA